MTSTVRDTTQPHRQTRFRTIRPSLSTASTTVVVPQWARSEVPWALLSMPSGQVPSARGLQGGRGERVGLAWRHAHRQEPLPGQMRAGLPRKVSQRSHRLRVKPSRGANGRRCFFSRCLGVCQVPAPGGYAGQQQRAPAVPVRRGHRRGRRLRGRQEQPPHPGEEEEAATRPQTENHQPARPAWWSTGRTQSVMMCELKRLGGVWGPVATGVRQDLGPVHAAVRDPRRGQRAAAVPERRGGGRPLPLRHREGQPQGPGEREGGRGAMDMKSRGAVTHQRC